MGIFETPWGKWELLWQGEDKMLRNNPLGGPFLRSPKHTVKVLTVNAGGILSLQSHDLRDEYWVPLETGLVAYLTKDGQSVPSAKLLRAHEVIHVEKGALHRLMNPTATTISLVEIIDGYYDEEDIKRYHDAYGRA